MIVDGVELLRMIRDGEFKDGDEIEENRRMFRYKANIESFYEVDGDENPMMNYYTDKEFASSEFEILSEEDKEIDIQAIEEVSSLDTADERTRKTNNLIKAIKQLDNKIK